MVTNMEKMFLHTLVSIYLFSISLNIAETDDTPLFLTGVMNHDYYAILNQKTNIHHNQSMPGEISS